MPLNYTIDFKNILKEETSSFHKRVEKHLDFLNESFNHVKYEKILKKYYGYFFPLEDKIKKFPSSISDNYEARASLLLEDLIKLQTYRDASRATTVPLCLELPNIETLDNVYGCLYVLEGSKLGNIIISKHLKKCLGIGPENGAAYFTSPLKTTWDRWHDFCHSLEKRTKNNPQSKESIIKSAQETFIDFERWILS